LLGVAVGLTQRVVDVDVDVDVDVGQLVATGQQRGLPGQVDQQPGRDRVELPTCPKVRVRRNVPSVDGARTR